MTKCALALTWSQWTVLVYSHSGLTVRLLVNKACAVKNWTTFEGVYFNTERYGADEKKLIYTNCVAMRKKRELFTSQSERHCWRHIWPWSWGPEMRFVPAQHQCLWPTKWSLFLSWSMFDASQLPAYTACFRLPKNFQLDAAKGHLAGLRSLNHPACYAPEGAPSTQACCLFSRTGEAAWTFLLLECYAIFTEGLRDCADSWSTTCSWGAWPPWPDSWPPSRFLTPLWWLDEALASLRCGLGAGCSRSSLLLCCFSIHNLTREHG